MKKNNRVWVYVGLAILLLGGSFAAGWYFSKKNFESKIVKKTTEIRWIKGKTIRDTIYKPKPYEIIKKDTVNYIEIIRDTIKVTELLDDYYCERKYNLDFSNDTAGEFKVDLLVSENQLISASSQITPYIKTITETNYIEYKKKLGFYALAGTSLIFNTQKLEFGFIIKDRWMLGLTGIRLKKEFNYTIDFGVKF